MNNKKEVGWGDIENITPKKDFGEIDDDVLQEMIEALSLYDYFTEEEDVQLVSTGYNMYHTNCPFSDHSDQNTKSFTIYEETNSFFCFGCQRGGTIFQWLTDPCGKNMHFLEAVSYVASLTGVNPILDPVAALEKLGEKIESDLLESPKTYLSKEELNFIISRLGYLHVKESGFKNDEAVYMERVYRYLDAILLRYEDYQEETENIKKKIIEKIQERKEILATEE